MSEQIPKLRVLSQCISPASKTVGHHRHREPELLLVTSGELRALLNGRELVLREGEGLFINSGAAHGVVANSKEGANFICVSFSTDCIAGADDTRLQARYVDPILKARNLDYVPLRGSGWANDICDIMRSMQSTYSSKMPGYELKLKIMVSEIWLTLYENCVPDLGDKRSVSHAEKARIDILRRFIQENYAEKITLEDIAASAHISRGECCRIFKRLYGTTPFQYLVHYRLTRSVYYLSETDKSISQIAQSVGFAAAAITPNASARSITARRSNSARLSIVWPKYSPNNALKKSAHGANAPWADWFYFTISISSPVFISPDSRTFTNMPSRGITQSPAALRIAQSLWHSLPICVTSHSAEPIRSFVPTGSVCTAMPSTRIFSANAPCLSSKLSFS